jgi:flagellar FliL protein
MDDKDDEEQATPVVTPPSVMKWAVTGGLAIFLAVLSAQVAAPIFTGMILGDPNAPADEMAEGEAEEAESPAPVPIKDRGAAIYVPLEPPLLASFAEEASGQPRYLQLTVQAMGRDIKLMDDVRTHAPAIRNAFLFLISNHSYKDIGTLEGKESLRAEMLTEAQAIMRSNSGDPAIEELYFTSFVVQ